MSPFAYLYIRLTVLLDKWHYSHYCMSTHKVDLFFHAVKYFVIRSWVREQPTDLPFDQLLDTVKCKTASTEYNHDKENRQDSKIPSECLSIKQCHPLH